MHWDLQDILVRQQMKRLEEGIVVAKAKNGSLAGIGNCVQETQ
jgi:hypothetical protein